MASALLGAHCGASPLATTVEAPSAPRHPDGVLLEPPPATPDAREHAPARGAVALREPAGDEEIVAVVRDYLAGFQKEDIEALREMLTSDATQLDAHGKGSPGSLVEFWRMRMRSYDYTKLADAELFRPERVERYEFSELGGQGERARPSEMRSGDLLVRVPIQTPRLQGDRLFGDVLVLMLRRDEGRLRIAGWTEEEGIP